MSVITTADESITDAKINIKYAIINLQRALNPGT